MLYYNIQHSFKIIISNKSCSILNKRKKSSLDLNQKHAVIISASPADKGY